MAWRARAVGFALLAWGALGMRDTFSLEDLRQEQLSLDGSGHATPPPTDDPDEAKRKEEEEEFAQERLALLLGAMGWDPLLNRPPSALIPDGWQSREHARVRTHAMYSQGASPYSTKRADISVRVASFNAGNLRLGVDSKWEDVRGLIHQMSKGHELADIVAFGLQEVHDRRGGLGDLARCSLWQQKGKRHVVLESAKFNTGFLCHHIPGNQHYDTNLYVLVNPDSEWSIRREDYSSAKCRKGEGGGCTMINSKRGECGKVVNLLVLSASRTWEAKTLGADFTTEFTQTARICIMNTHMSFLLDASARMHAMDDALKETGLAGANCDTTLFLGDFNSRLHCKPLGVHQSMPACENAGSYGSSMEYLLGRFRTSPWDATSEETFSLNGESEQLDELVQLTRLRWVECWEKEEGANKLKGFWNILHGQGLTEGQVNFKPTYKFANKDKADKERGAKVHKHLLHGKEKCYLNKDGKGKHNPAWTDRVLVKGNAKVNHYDMLDISAAIDSDHAPVIANVVVTPKLTQMVKLQSKI